MTLAPAAATRLMADHWRRNATTDRDWKHVRKLEAMAAFEEKYGDRASGVRPSFFVCVCRTASSSGGSYAGPGYSLAIHVRELIADDVGADVAAKLNQFIERAGEALGSVEEWTFEEAVANETMSAVLDEAWEWFGATVPRCMELVPARRKQTFMRGVFRAMQQSAI